MQIIEYNGQGFILEFIKNCDWEAGVLLYNIITKQNGIPFEWYHLFCLVEKEKVISFCTLSKKDCVDDENMFPWLGFVYTLTSKRNCGYARKIIEYTKNIARDLGYKKIFLDTDKSGFYEKFGFHFIEHKITIYGQNARIYGCDL